MSTLTETPMRSVSIRQPWAWAIMQGRQTVVNRYWGTALGPVAIHAAARWDSDALDSFPMREAWALHHMEDSSERAGKLRHRMGRLPKGAHNFSPGNPLFPTGAILGIVDIVDVHSVDPVRGCFHEGDAFGWDPVDRSGEGGLAQFCSPWARVPDSPTHGNQRGLKHLVLAHPRPLANPLPFTGHMNIHRLPLGVAQIIRSGLPS